MKRQADSLRRDKITRVPVSFIIALSIGLVVWLVLPEIHAGPRRRRHQHHHRVVVRPPVGHVVRTKPRGAVSLHVGGIPLFYFGGIFYKSSGTSFAVVAAPIGAVVPTLPIGHTVLYVGGAPYYTYNDTYYTYDDARSGYVVVSKPPEVTETAGVVAYPLAGQSEALQAQDRYECHAWAVRESSFDPSRGVVGSDAMRTQYNKAMKACLVAKNYSVQ